MDNAIRIELRITFDPYCIVYLRISMQKGLRKPFSQGKHLQSNRDQVQLAYCSPESWHIRWCIGLRLKRYQDISTFSSGGHVVQLS